MQLSRQRGPGALWSLSPAPGQGTSVPCSDTLGCSGTGQPRADAGCGSAEQVLMAAQRPAPGPPGHLGDTELRGQTVSGGWVVPSSLTGFP